MNEIKKDSFEEKLQELEKISISLERGNISLEDAISTFEKGINLSKECSLKLDEAERKINILTKDSSGNINEEEFVKE